MIHLAKQTLEVIERSIHADQGAAYRVALGKVIPHMDDAYRGEEDGFRSHLGASLLGGDCARKLWYGFRWVLKPTFSGQVLRLFNRGHLEEARFIAILLSIGVKVYQQDANGKQFRISSLGGHLGGSTDGVLVGVPELGQIPALGEFKTHNAASFEKLVKEGVQKSKFEHYIQMQIYMRKMNLTVALYMAVNKNTDEIYAEFVMFDQIIADQYIDRGHQIIMLREAPKRLHDSAGWFECKYCDYVNICHRQEEPDMNCRSCTFSVAVEDGTWRCINYNVTLTKEQQQAGCKSWEPNHTINL